MLDDTPRTNQPKIGVVFGGSGLIGGTIVNYYNKHHPGLVDMRAPSSKKVSLRDCDDIRNYLVQVKPDFVVNTAIANIDADAQLAFEVNYIGTLNIARAALALQIPYIHFSSAATLRLGQNVSEEDQMPIYARLSNYGRSKLMAEHTLDYMAQHEGLDYSGIRLSVVYGSHDHKIQGFHRLLYSIADESMPCLFTQKGIKHSYTSNRKIPHLVHHMLNNRQEFGGKIYNFVDPDPIDLAELILAIRSHLQLKRPREIYVPYSVARSGKRMMRVVLRMLTRLGVKGALPPELMFLSAFYQTQTLSCKRLEDSSFVDPRPKETVYTRLPEMILYYLTRWSQQNLITTFDQKLNFDTTIKEDFERNPQKLLEAIHGDATQPFAELQICPMDELKQ